MLTLAPWGLRPQRQPLNPSSPIQSFLWLIHHFCHSYNNQQSRGYNFPHFIDAETKSQEEQWLAQRQAQASPWQCSAHPSCQSAALSGILSPPHSPKEDIMNKLHHAAPLSRTPPHSSRTGPPIPQDSPLLTSSSRMLLFPPFPPWPPPPCNNSLARC